MNGIKMGSSRSDEDNRPDGGPTGDNMRDVGSRGYQDEAAGPILAEAELPPLFRYNLADGPNITQDPAVPGGSGEVGMFYDGNFWKGASDLSAFWWGFDQKLKGG